MKKLIAGCVAGIVGASVLLGAAACAASGPTETADREAPVFENAAATVTVDAKTDKNDSDMKISDSLFGVFLEDINYASYALDDNLVANGSFEALTESKSREWKALSGATLTTENTNGIFKNQTEYNAKNVNPYYARITVTSANAGVYNTGYVAVPMAVTKDVEYEFSAFLKADAAVKATVKMTDGTSSYWTTEFSVPQGTEWIKYSRTVKATESKSENLRLELTFDKATTVYLDAVAFETKDSTVGIKNYIYNAIKDMAPKFIRFPGGCVIEGTDETEAYDWKNSVGAVQNGNNAGDDTIPAFTYKLDTNGTATTTTTYGEPATRKPNEDNWAGADYYDMEYAVGFYEYFRLCDSIGASAVPVLNCGLSDQGGLKYKNEPHPLAGRHNKGVEDYIQDAVDLIEFAKGGTDTKWGKLRELLGHPEPFAMDYLGIGNEQFGEYFDGYYEKFLDSTAFQSALKTYSVKPIVGNAMTLGDCEKPETNRLGVAQRAAQNYRKKHAAEHPNLSDYGVHDQHYYVNYTDLFANTTLYDYYSREETERYEVFVGEYSANSYWSGGESYAGDSEWANSWITAISEAAAMTGFERNGDIVKLAAYAPMFAPVNTAHRQWNIDMMYFTNTQLVLSTNYYVQQLFMKNLGAYTPKKSLMTFAQGFEQTYEISYTSAAGASARMVEIEKLYYVASVAENGDVIVKIVNASPDAVKMNFNLSNINGTGIADVTELASDDWKAQNTLTETKISPESYTIGNGTMKEFGHEIKPYSVTAIRVHAK